MFDGYYGYGNGISSLFSSFNSIYWILFFGVSLISWLVQANLQSKFNKYSKIPAFSGMTGKATAEKMLSDYGIKDVSVECISGQLTDHYNPLTKTLNLSTAVYNGNSIMAVAVAAHECGHAVQHATAYSPLTLRSKLVPVVTFSSKWMTWVLLGGMLILSFFNNPWVLGAGIVLFSFTTLFAFITLPVEINASSRAITWLDQRGMTDKITHEYAVKALRAAAYTYVVAALSSLASLLYYMMIFLSGSRRR